MSTCSKHFCVRDDQSDTHLRSTEIGKTLPSAASSIITSTCSECSRFSSVRLNTCRFMFSFISVCGGGAGSLCSVANVWGIVTATSFSTVRFWMASSWPSQLKRERDDTGVWIWKYTSYRTVSYVKLILSFLCLSKWTHRMRTVGAWTAGDFQHRVLRKHTIPGSYENKHQEL